MTHAFSHLEWPFFDQHHRQLATELDAWCSEEKLSELDDTDIYAACADLVARMGHAGWLKYAVPAGNNGELGGALPQLESRSLCLIREIFGRHHTLADFAFAMQGLGSGAISLGGNAQLQQRYLPKVAAGQDRKSVV